MPFTKQYLNPDHVLRIVARFTMCEMLKFLNDVYPNLLCFVLHVLVVGKGAIKGNKAEKVFV